MNVTPLEALPLHELRQRSSAKWRTYPQDVLPLFVAETDFALAPAIAERLSRAIALGDTGYATAAVGVVEAYAGFAERRFDWDVSAATVRSTGDVMMGVVELLRAVTAPGDRVIVTPPVYPPFYSAVPLVGAVIESVPLVETDDGWRLDLPGIEAAFAAGARAMLLCNPHNPTGTVHPAETLARLAHLAARFGVTVISDEIHAPLVQTDAGFTPFLSASASAADVGFAVTSASKAFNLAGLKCALLIASGAGPARTLAALPAELDWKTGLFGAMASVAAFSPESDAWLDALIATLDDNRRLLGDLLAAHVPGAVYHVPDAGFLAWVDLRALEWGDDPAEKILDEASVAVHHGPQFGDAGRGHVRINFGCAPEVLTEAVERIGTLTAS